MELSEAFAILGITPEADRQEIRTAFRERAKLVHSDTTGAGDEAMTRLNIAYSVAEQALPAVGTDLVPIGATTALITALRGGAVTAGRERSSAQVVGQLVSHQVTPLKAATRRLATVGLLSGGLGVLGFISRSSAKLGLPDTVYGVVLVLGPLLSAMAVILAVLAWHTTARASLIRDALQDAADSMSDKGSFLEVINEIRVAGHLGSTWTRQELIDAVKCWSDGHRPVVAALALATWLFAGPRRITLRSVATQTGPEDFARLAIAKGQELDLVSEKAMLAPDGRPVFRYSLSLPGAAPPEH